MLQTKLLSPQFRTEMSNKRIYSLGTFAADAANPLQPAAIAANEGGGLPFPVLCEMSLFHHVNVGMNVSPDEGIPAFPD